MARRPVPAIRHYFVDEAGDDVLFNRRGQVIIGREGCSHYFMLGMLDAADPWALTTALDQLRKRLLADPYFRDVASMQPEAKKTAIAFHAKDDLPEVRREVFSLLLEHRLRFFACVKDKHKVLAYVRQRNQSDPTYRYHPNELYDLMIRRLFKTLLHRDDEYWIHFAMRGRSDRTGALRRALEAARNRFAAASGIKTDAIVHIVPGTPRGRVCLQAADYFLWALQRLYERHEERFVGFLWPAFRVVNDMDDTREARYGVYYTQKRPLTLAALGGDPGI